MAKRMASVMVALLAAACSGSTGSSDPVGGGTSSGGAASGGTSSGGAASGGTSSAGTSNVAGKPSGGSVNSGGSGSADKRCPPKMPMPMPNGTCDADEAGLSCQYDQFTACLCYAPPDLFGYCQPVDAMCTAATGSGGAAEAGSGGGGGISTKVAIAPWPYTCTCSAEAWTCVLQP